MLFLLRRTSPQADPHPVRPRAASGSGVRVWTATCTTLAVTGAVLAGVTGTLPGIRTTTADEAAGLPATARVLRVPRPATTGVTRGPVAIDAGPAGVVLAEAAARLAAEQAAWEAARAATARTVAAATARAALLATAGRSGVDWDGIARCETGGNWSMQGPRFSGGVGFYNGTWDAFGGREFAPNAGQASRQAQIVVAERVWDRYGLSGWGCKAYG